MGKPMKPNRKPRYTLIAPDGRQSSFYTIGALRDYLAHDLLCYRHRKKTDYQIIASRAPTIPVDVCYETAYGTTVRLPFMIRCF